MKIITLLLLAATIFASCQSSAPLLNFANDEVPLNEIFSFEIELVAGPADEVSVDADMPAHGHGMVTKPIVTAIDNYRYQVDGMLLHMPGYWEIYIDVTRNGSSKRFVVPLTIEAWQ